MSACEELRKPLLPAVLLKPQETINGQNKKKEKRKMVVCGTAVGRLVCVWVCVSQYKHGSVETPYLAIALPPLLGVLLVLLQGGLGLPL